MSKVTIQTLLKTYHVESEKNMRYKHILDRMSYEILQYSTYYLLGVMPIEETTEINMDLLKDAAKKATNIFCNSKGMNILKRINDEYGLIRKMIISVKFNFIDDDIIEVDEWIHLKDLYNFLMCSCWTDELDEDDDDIFNTKSKSKSNTNMIYYNSHGQDWLFIQK
jgi:hypothetical protein